MPLGHWAGLRRTGVLVLVFVILAIVVAVNGPGFAPASHRAPSAPGGLPCSLCPGHESEASPGPSLPRDLLAVPVVVEIAGTALPLRLTRPMPTLKEALLQPPDIPPRAN